MDGKTGVIEESSECRTPEDDLGEGGSAREDTQQTSQGHLVAYLVPPDLIYEKA